jgi:hypothetical protein
MAKIIELPPNIIGKDDLAALESFGGHEISHGRLTKFHWDYKDNDDPVLEFYRGGINETLVCKISRDRKKDEFRAIDPEGDKIVTGSLDHVMKVLDDKLTREHDESKTSA